MPAMNIEVNAFLLVLATSVSLLLITHAVLAFGVVATRRRRTRLETRPLVSILRPLCGIDEGLLPNLESLARTRYQGFELLIGIADRHDPAWGVAEQFARAHPDLAIRLICTERGRAANPKVAQLIELTRNASGSVLVVSDANVRVGPDWLVHMLEQLHRPGTGLVSGIVAGADETCLGAAIENAHLCGYVAPVVATAAWAGRPVTVGKSMMMRRRDLESVGGWEAVAGVLAEDDVLGQRFRSHGYAVRVSLDPVSNVNSHCSVTRTLERHTRWARMRRSINPLAFALEPLANPLWVAGIWLMVSPSATSVSALAGVALLQVLATTASTWLLRGTKPGAWMLLAELVRPWILLGCWAAGWTSRRTSWRGHEIEIGAGSVIRRRGPGQAPPPVAASHMPVSVPPWN